MLRLLLLAFLALTLLDCQKRAEPSGEGQQGASPSALLERVSPSNVCMANNRYMSEPQIPVVVEDKTYYGCCPMCEQRLRDDAAIRSSKDPVSGQSVDKALAVIGKLGDGRVLYFESDKTFAAYAAKQARAAQN